MSGRAEGTSAGGPHRRQDFADSRNTRKEAGASLTTPQMSLCGCGASSVIPLGSQFGPKGSGRAVMRLRDASVIPGPWKEVKQPKGLAGPARILWYKFAELAMRRALVPGVLLGIGLLLVAGCAWFRPTPTPILPADELYKLGSENLEKRLYEDSRQNFKKIVERYPDSPFAPRARFLTGEAYYREADFGKAIREFDLFMSFYPRHEIADLVQYRLAMAYYDQMKPIEQDQAPTTKAIEQFKKLVKDYPESRYATDALARIDICRGRLAQKELWVANYYFTQGNPGGARQRLELILKEYPRTLVIPETLWLLADVNLREGKTAEATGLLQRLSAEYSYTDYGRRAAQRLRAQR
jgi:outer membrane protein assembly factor BamD